MGFSTLFIQRPIATSLLMVALLLLGLIGFRGLPVSALPDIDAPSLVVTTQYPGASASTMAALVTTPLERQFGQISGVAMMSSDSSAGLSTIVIQFDMDRDIDAAGQDVQSAINAARGTLPNNLPYPPVYNKVNPADAPILTLMLTSDSRPLRDVNDYADSIIAQKISQIAGVGLVSIAGNVRPAVRVQVNPAQLANLGLTMEDVRSALTQANVNAPKGSLNGAVQSFSASAPTTSSPTPTTTARRSSRTRTMRRCASPTSPRSPTASRTISLPPGRTANPPCCSISAASRARTSCRRSRRCARRCRS